MTPQELKNSILQLAIQGKLVEQRPEEGTAEELYAQIQAEKQALVKAGKIKKDKPLPEITEGEAPFEIPKNWKWARLRDICTKIVDGDHNPPAGVPTKTNYLMLSAQNICDDHISNLEQVRFISEEVFRIENERTCAQTGDIFFTIVGTLGRSCVYEGGYNICFQRSVSVLTTLIYNYYLKYALDSAYIQQYMVANATGTAQKGFYLNQVEKLLIPLPPLAEQKRIVAKIEELLPYIDRYEKAWSRLEDFNKRFPVDMQKSILQLAIQGKLVEQRPEEGTAEELYRQIQAEKQALIKAGKIKKEKPLPEIAEDEVPFEIPESWKWVRIADVTDMLSGFAFQSSEFKPDGKYRLLRGINLGVNSIRWKDTVYIDSMPDRLDAFRLGKGDVLLGLDRPWISEGTRVCVYNESEEAYLVQRVLRLRGLSGVVSDYIALILHSSRMKETLGGETTGISVPHISPNQVGSIAIPLPPLAEQKRIVAKLEELLPLCERLK